MYDTACQYRIYGIIRLTLKRTYATDAKVGRKLIYPVRITLTMSDDMSGKIDAALRKDEPRLDLIREAIERELKRRREDDQGNKPD